MYFENNLTCDLINKYFIFLKSVDLIMFIDLLLIKRLFMMFVGLCPLSEDVAIQWS